MEITASVLLQTNSRVIRSALKALNQRNMCSCDCVSSDVHYDLNESHLLIHMDEAVGTLQRESSSANYFAMMEMVVILQASYLSKHIQH